MPKNGGLNLKKVKRAAIFAALYLLVTLFYLLGAFDEPDRFLSDKLFTTYRPAAQNIFVIGIDEETLDAYGPWNQWSRTMTADLINYLNGDPKAKPAVIGLDLLFSGNTTAEADQALAEAVKTGGNVVLASQVVFSKELGEAGQWDYMHVRKYEEPFPALREHAPSGLMNVISDSDGIVRSSLHAVSYDGKTINSLAEAVYGKYAAEQKIAQPNKPPLNGRGQWYIPFAGRPGEFFGTAGKGTSWVRVMKGEIPRELFADAIVLVGPYSLGMMDSYFTSVDRNAPMFGVEIHANVVQALLEGNFKQYISGYAELAFTLALALLLYAAFTRLKLWQSGLLFVGAGGVYVVAAVGLFHIGCIVTVFYPLVMLAASYLAGLVSNQIMLTVEKARLYDRIQRLLHNSIATIANTIDAKDPCTSGHCQRVAKYAQMIGRGLGLSDDDLSDLEYTAILHDVGKIGVADSILKKQGKLTDEEYEEMKTHPIRGAAILEQIEEFNSRITEGTRYHHERFDGKGYCQGLSGMDIPLFARIISVADTYDAMTQNRPYRGRMTRQQAVAELERSKGTQLDPEITELFISMLRSLPEAEFEDQPDSIGAVEAR